MVSILALVITYPFISALAVYYGLRLGKSFFAVLKNEFWLFASFCALYIGVMFVFFFATRILLSDLLAFAVFTITYFAVSVGLKMKTMPTADIFKTPPEAFRP